MKLCLRFAAAAVVTLAAASAACSSGSAGFGTDNPDGGPPPGDGGPSLLGDTYIPPVGEGGMPPPNGTPLIYAHTDSELYTMDPTTHVVTDIGAFDDGTGSAPTITDLAVNANGDVYVNSETAIYKATVPKTAGKVSIALVTTLQTSTKFYALGFTPAGALEGAESLIAGDSGGSLYYIPTTANAMPQTLGGFGGSWALSGDVVFYSVNGAPRGLATIRTSPSSTNDSLAEIDMAALKQAYTSHTQGTLLKQVIGSGAGYGHLYGIGAWGDSVYAFSRGSSTKPASLIQIGATGSGTQLQSFANIMNGWSGAGVTTTASITIIK
jgi:hypothetical protein